MNYCSNCGSSQLDVQVPEGDILPRKVCLNCQTIHYINPNMVVGCIPVYKDKIMLAKRGIEPRKGFWNLPCGFLELNETAEEGAVREVFEETGNKVEIKYLHTVYSVVHSAQVYLIYIADMANDEFQLTLESTEIKLFNIDEIPWKELAFSANVYALEKYLKDLNEGFKNVHLGSFNNVQ